MTDWELLREYAQQDSETAFATLVERHIPLVYSAAVRQTNNPALAEDITQGVFVLLAGKASKINDKTILAGWLYRAARNLAQTALRTERRRRQREAAAAQLDIGSPEPDLWEQVAPALDEAMAQLGETDRNALLLRFFQNKKLLEVGLALGLTEEAAKKRVARAVNKLRNLFVQRGIALTGAALAGVLTARAVHAAPAALVASISAGRGPKTDKLAPNVALLVEEALRDSSIATVKWALGLVGVIGLATFLGLIAWQRWTSTSRLPQRFPGVVSAPQGAAQARAAPAIGKLAPIPAAIPLRALADTDGQPLPRVAVHVRYSGRDDASLDLITDGEGRCRIPLAGRAFRTVDAVVDSGGYTPRGASWFRYELEGRSDMDEYVLRLDRGRAFSGLIQDQAGLPIPSAQVTIGGPAMDLSIREHGSQVFATTDLDGHWSSDQLAAGIEQLDLTVEHPDYCLLSTNLSLSATNSMPPILVLQPGVSVSGVVQEPNGAPVVGAEVGDSPLPGALWQKLDTTTDFDGRFFFPHVQAGPLRLSAHAPGHSASTNQVNCSTDIDDVRIVLSPAPPTAGQSNAPPAELFVHLSGTVQDADTGQPIDRFQVLLNGRQSVAFRKGPSELPLSWGWLEGQSEFLGESKGGVFDWNWPPSNGGLLEFKIEVRAAGYSPALSELISITERTNVLHFSLQKSDQIAGLVLSPDGRPAAAAIVQLAGKDSMPKIQARPGAPLDLAIYAPNQQETQTLSDQAGRFTLKPVAGADRLILLHESGCGVVRLPVSAPIKLHPWGRIEGHLKIGALNGTNQTVEIETCPADRGDLFIPFHGVMRTDNEGAFAFQHVPPGNYHLFRGIHFDGTPSGPYALSHHTLLQVAPADSTQVTLGGSGRRVIARVRTLPENGIPNWGSSFQGWLGQPSGPGQPGLGDDIFCFLFHYCFQIQPDGSCSVDDVPPGPYQLHISLTAPMDPPPPGSPDRNPRREVGTLSMDVRIPEPAAESPDQPVDLGVLTVELHK